MKTMVSQIPKTLFNLEPIADNKVYFPKYVRSYLDGYTSCLEKIHCDNDVIEAVMEFSNSIVCSLLEYYSGQHRIAYEYLSAALKRIDIRQIICELVDTRFYRARKAEERGICLAKSEMLHVPFEKRYLAKTQRYSYPGLPCLYLGSSVDVCCEEIGCRDADVSIATIRSCKKKIKVLDLCFFKDWNFDNLSDEQKQEITILWPLVACCSFSYKDSKDMAFRPDYIIPQLLLEYIVDRNATNDITGSQDKVVGIRYYSVREMDKEIPYRRDRINYAFPVQKSAETGLSEDITAIFYVKDVQLCGTM